MFQTSQCVTSIFELLLSAGSGSCISRTKLCVPGGTCDHLSSGDGASGPAACVYLSGMTPPSSQAVVVMRSGGVCGPRPRPCPPPAGGPCARSAALVATIIEATNADFIVSFPVRLKADTTYFSSNFLLLISHFVYGAVLHAARSAVIDPSSDTSSKPKSGVPVRADRMNVLVSSTGSVAALAQNDFILPSCLRYSSTFDR